MISPTKQLQKIIFWPLVVISAGLNAMLFYFFGSNIFSSSTLGLLGICLVAFQVLALRDWKNAIFRKAKPEVIKQKKRIWRFATSFSIIASLFFGLQEIEKRVNIYADKVAAVENITASINELEKSLTIDTSDLIRKQILDMQKETVKNTEYGGYRKDKTITSLRHELKYGKFETLDKIADAKIKRAKLNKALTSNVSGFSVVSSMILPFLKTTTAEKWIRFVFLAAMSIALELAILTTGTFSEVKKKEVKENHQMTFSDLPKLKTIKPKRRKA